MRSHNLEDNFIWDIAHIDVPCGDKKQCFSSYCQRWPSIDTKCSEFSKFCPTDHMLIRVTQRLTDFKSPPFISSCTKYHWWVVLLECMCMTFTIKKPQNILRALIYRYIRYIVCNNFWKKSVNWTIKSLAAQRMKICRAMPTIRVIERLKMSLALCSLLVMWNKRAKS